MLKQNERAHLLPQLLLLLLLLLQVLLLVILLLVILSRRVLRLLRKPASQDSIGSYIQVHCGSSHERRGWRRRQPGNGNGFQIIRRCRRQPVPQRQERGIPVSGAAGHAGLR